MYEAGRHSSNDHLYFDEEKMVLLNDAAACRQTKKQQLCTQMGDLIHQLQISDTTNENLTQQIKILTNENNALKEKMAFFQHLMSGNPKSGVSIHQFNLKETAIPGNYRYSLTLIQGGERPNDFKGNLRFQVKLLQNDQYKTIPLVNKDDKKDFPVNFKFLHRLEETFKIPANATAQSMLVEVHDLNIKKVILTQSTQPTP